MDFAFICPVSDYFWKDGKYTISERKLIVGDF